jgi:hypothetical protein
VELVTHDYPADAEGDTSFQRWPVTAASCVEAYLPMAMTRHGCKQCGSTPAHRNVPSRLQAVWKHICSQGCPVMVASSEKHTCFPFCVRGVRSWRSRLHGPLSGSFLHSGEWIRLLGVGRGGVVSWGVGRGETCARRVLRGGTPSMGIGRAGDLFCWAELGRSCVHNYFRRAKADVHALWVPYYRYPTPSKQI